MEKNGISSKRTTQCIWAVVVLAALEVFAIVTLSIIKPNDISTGTMIVGVIAPIILALLGIAVQGVHMAVNSRLTQLLELTAKSSLAEGKLTLTISPNVPIVVPPANLPNS